MVEAPDEGFRVTDRRRRDIIDTPSPPGDPPTSHSAPFSSSTPDARNARSERSLIPLFMMLATQALIALGETPDPVTGQRRRELAHASAAIDLLSLLREKTEGHRTPDEARTLEDLIYDLQLSYVKAVKPPAE